MTSISLAEEYELIPRKISKLLTQHRTKPYLHLLDRMIMVNPDLKEMLEFVKSKVSENWYKTIRGSILGLFMRRYMLCLMNPQQHAHRMDLILFANYSIIKNYLQRTVKVLISEYGLKNRYYRFKIKTNELYKLSELWSEELFEVCSNKMIPHYKKLTLGVPKGVPQGVPKG